MNDDLVYISFNLSGQNLLDRALGLYARNVRDLRGAWDEIRDDFLDHNAEQFDSEGRHASGGWTELSPVYAAWKAAHLPGMPILQRSGRLMDSLTDRGHRDFIYEPEALRVRMGTKVPYARYHQSGTARLPARPPIALTDAQRKQWMKTIQAHIFHTSQLYQRAIL